MKHIEEQIAEVRRVAAVDAIAGKQYRSELGANTAGTMQAMLDLMRAVEIQIDMAPERTVPEIWRALDKLKAE